MSFSKNLSILLLSLFLAASCSTSKKAAEAKPSGPAGDWMTVISGTPMGDINAEMVLMEEEDTYKGYIISEGDRIDFRDLKVENNEVSASFYHKAYQTDVYLDLNYKPETDTMEGWVMDQFRIKGERKEAEGE